jgi:hypothetical protein
MLEFANISQKSNSQFRVLGDGHVVYRKFQNEGPQLLNLTIQNFFHDAWHIPGRCNTNFGRGDELWNNTAVKQGKYVLYSWLN